MTLREPTPELAETADPIEASLARRVRMRIGYVLSNFPPISETFIRREILALCDLGHRVFVYPRSLHSNPKVEPPRSPRLKVRQVSWHASVAALVEAARADGVEHLHGSLMLSAQMATYAAARELELPFSITAYSGHTVFTSKDPDLYRSLSRSSQCAGIVVEDPFMRDWVTRRLGADPSKTTVIPNSLDLELYRLREPRPARERLRVLAIARFVEKKGFLHLIEAFQTLSATRKDIELWLVGGGPEEKRLRRAAAGNRAIRFPGFLTEADCRQAYVDADVFCLPCIQAPSGDADGVPTVVLEAMAMELPVVTSNLLSTPHYVRDGKEGLLTSPGDSLAIAACLDRLLGDARLRRKMGRQGRQRVVKLCDLERNSRRLSDFFVRHRHGLWQSKLGDLLENRERYTAETLAGYEEKRRRAIAFFQPTGRFLDIGCGDGDLRRNLGAEVSYVGCDPVFSAAWAPSPGFLSAWAEALPFADESFDGALLYAVLPHVLSVDRCLSEAARVLKPGGRLYLQECVDDPNPLHLNRLSDADLRSRLKSRFDLVRARADGPRRVLIVARKRSSESALPVEARPQAEAPLVSIAITAYNRERYVVQCLKSALRQSYGRVEVVLVDDGSSDRTRRLLEPYRDRVKMHFNRRNRGIAHAKNKALRMTSEGAKYVAILDSDDYLHPDFVRRCVAALEASPQVGLVYTDHVVVNSRGKEVGQQTAIEPWSVNEWLRTRNLSGDCWLARRRLVMETELHDESLPLDVDYDLFYQLLEVTTFEHLPEYLVYVRTHARRSTRNALELARCHAANLVKYGHDPEFAYLRARGNPRWIPAVEEGIALGKKLRARRMRSRSRRAPEETLAVDGGEPVRASYLPFGQPCIGQEEIDEVVATLRSRWIGTGPRVVRFEEEFAAYVGAGCAVALSSCTAGLFLSLKSFDVGPGDEVITTPLTFAATLNVIEHVGATPVVADVDPETFNLDPEHVERAVTAKTKAILPVHFGGLACDLDALSRIAARHGVAVIEDAAHAVGSRHEGRMIGGFGNLTAFSFYANKNLTTAEGGVVTTDDEDLASRLRRLRLHGLGKDAWARFKTAKLAETDLELPGYKMNMTDLAAALGLPQLRKQERFLEIRELYASRYDEAFADLPLRRQRKPSASDKDNRHSLHLYLLRLEEDRWSVDRDRVVRALLAENVGAAVHYRPAHTLSFYRKKYRWRAEDVSQADRIGRTVLSLPLSPAMSEADVQDVIAAVRKVAAAYAT